MPKATPTARLFTRCAAPLVLAGLLMAACGDDDETTYTVPPTTRVVVTSVKGDVTSELLAAIYGRALEDAGFSVARRDPVDLDRAGYYAAVEEGTIHLIPDWSGEVLTFVYSLPGADTAPTTLVPDSPATTQAPIIVTTTTTIEVTTTLAPDDTTGDTAGDTTTTVETTTTDGTTTTVETTTTDGTTSTVETTTTVADETTTTIETTTTTEAPITNGRSVLEQLTSIRAALADTVAINSGVLAEDKVVIACTPAAIEVNDDTELFTLTNLASNAPKIRLGASAEWQDDEEQGLPAFTQFYGGEFDEIVTVEQDGLAAAITDGDIDCMAIESLNPLITTERLRILYDDQVMIPGNGAIALLSGEIATPDLVAVLDSLATSLTTERLNQMLNEITANGTDPAVVANAFVDTL